MGFTATERGWKSQYEMTKKHCIHGQSCKNKPTCLGRYYPPSVGCPPLTMDIYFSLCIVGSRLTHIHLLSGGILPLLSLMESTLARNAHSMTFSKEVRSLRVVRVRLDDGRRLIGIRYPLPLISEIGTMLSAVNHRKQVDS